MKEIIKIKNLSLNLGRKKILKNINLSIREKEFVIFLGPNGAGKTTLLKTILGFYKNFEGKIYVFSKELKSNLREILKKITYIPQKFYFDRRLPFLGKDLLNMGLYFSNDKRKGEKVLQFAERFGITHLLEKPLKVLSGGEFQKLNLIRALLQEPEIILLDEPLNFLDPLYQRVFLDMLTKVYLEFNLTVILVIHHINLIPKICNRFILISGGRILKDVNLKGLIETDILNSLYGFRLNHLETEDKIIFYA